MHSQKHVTKITLCSSFFLVCDGGVKHTNLQHSKRRRKSCKIEYFSAFSRFILRGAKSSANLPKRTKRFPTKQRSKREHHEIKRIVNQVEFVR
jgi:hypothetical protein